jgi:hypothetical protein
MRTAINAEHRHFFAKNHYIEFEDLVEEADLVREHVDQLLAKRTKKIIDTRTPKELFIAGRDMFRDDPVIRKTSLSRTLAQTASLLCDKAPVRIAYDQVLRTTSLTGAPFSHPLSLSQTSCYQPILCGAIIRLTPDLHPPQFLPQKPGNVVFFKPDFILPWVSFFQAPSQSFLLIAYAPHKCLYVLTPEDLHSHDLKKLGYGFGDILKDETHPLVFK